MMLGSHLLLRRIDTDFINLMPIVAYSGGPYPVLSTISNAITVAKGSTAVSGTWVPLSAAQAYVRDHPGLQGGPFDLFLSDVLFERFPTALQDFHKSSCPGRTLNHFGPHFGSTLQATQLYCQTDMQNTLRDGLMNLNESYPMPVSSLALPSSLEQGFDEADCPLSAAEQEIFREICDIPDSDENTAPPSPTIMVVDEEDTLPASEVSPLTASSPEPTGTGDSECSERPLRRSKRVANAIAAQSRTRTRSRRGGSRSSLL